MKNDYSEAEYSTLRAFALKLKGLEITEDLPVADFVDRAYKVSCDMAIEPEWYENQQIMELIEGFNQVFIEGFQAAGHDKQAFYQDLKMAAAEDLDEF